MVPRQPSLEPRVQAFVTALEQAGAPPLYTLSPAEARKVLREVQAIPVTTPNAEVEDRELPDGVQVRIVRAPGLKRPSPAVLYLHGGGWVLGDAYTHDRLIHELAIGAAAAVVLVQYTPSPDVRFPAAIEQAYTAMHWIARHGAEADLDGTRIAIAGDSAGGNMAAAVTLLARRRGGPSPCHQVLFYPVTSAKLDATDSYQQFAAGPWLSRASMQWFWDQYLPDASKREDPLVSPLNTSAEELRSAPPTLVITAENDVLRDEGEAYATRLASTGVAVTAVRYLGTIHDFVMLNALAETPAAKAAIYQAGHALRLALHPHGVE